jgi:hypothetical protein
MIYSDHHHAPRKGGPITGDMLSRLRPHLTIFNSEGLASLFICRCRSFLDVADSLNNLALPYHAKRYYKRAEPLLRRALAERVRSGRLPHVRRQAARSPNIFKACGPCILLP